MPEYARTVSVCCEFDVVPHHFVKENNQVIDIVFSCIRCGKECGVFAKKTKPMSLKEWGERFMSHNQRKI